jgi:hypothetical protein
MKSEFGVIGMVWVINLVKTILLNKSVRRLSLVVQINRGYVKFNVCGHGGRCIYPHRIAKESGRRSAFPCAATYINFGRRSSSSRKYGQYPPSYVPSSSEGWASPVEFQSPKMQNNPQTLSISRCRMQEQQVNPKENPNAMNCVLFQLR